VKVLPPSRPSSKAACSIAALLLLAVGACSRVDTTTDTTASDTATVTGASAAQAIGAPPNAPPSPQGPLVNAEGVPTQSGLADLAALLPTADLTRDYADIDKLPLGAADATAMNDFEGRARVRPMLSVDVGAGNRLVVLQATPLDNGGEEALCHACSALVLAGVVDPQRKVLVPAAAMGRSGTFGAAGEARMVGFGIERPGFAITETFLGQGIALSAVSLWEYTGGKIVKRTTNPVPISTDNSAAGCGENGQPACEAIEANWSIGLGQPDDLILRFTGKTAKGVDVGGLQVVYRLVNGVYAPVDGKNPIEF
jgi:hypothetical protein